MSPKDKPLVWLHGVVKTPPLSSAARTEAGYLLRRLQRGDALSLPHARPMGAIGSRYHELQIIDQKVSWRITYRIDADAIVILEVFEKQSRQTPKAVIEACKKRLASYDA